MAGLLVAPVPVPALGRVPARAGFPLASCRFCRGSALRAFGGVVCAVPCRCASPASSRRRAALALWPASLPGAPARPLRRGPVAWGPRVFAVCRLCGWPSVRVLAGLPAGGFVSCRCSPWAWPPAVSGPWPRPVWRFSA